jgi:hypothetical protein
MAGIFNGLFWLVFWTLAIIFSFGSMLLLFVPYLFLTFAGGKKRQDKANEKLSTVLMASEVIASKAIQVRIFSLWSRRTLVAITNSRLLVLKRGVFGGFKMQDIQWKDLKDARMKENILSNVCGSNVNFEHLNAGVGKMDVKGLPNQGATEIYTKAQAEEQAWEEKRRVREIEDVRAASGGTVIHTGAPASSSEAPQSRHGGNMLQQIEDAKKLLDQGVISDAEFQEMKAKIIS